MKEVISLCANFFLSAGEDGKNHPQAEIVLIFSEPVYHIDLSGEVVKRRDPSQVRFMSHPEMLRKLAKSLSTLADECEAKFPTP